MDWLDKARERMRRIRLESELDNGRYFYWIDNLDDAILVLWELDERVIQEPEFDSEEYRNGERKPPTQDYEQEEEEEREYSGEYDVAVERDEDGYLIR